MELNIGIPVFIEPTMGEKPNSEWRLAKLSPSKIKITLVNTGNTHLFISQLALQDQTGNTIWRNQNLFNYILNHESQSWIAELKKPVPDQPLVLTTNLLGTESIANVVKVPE